MERKDYRDFNGRLLFVQIDWPGSGMYGTFRQTRKGIKRVTDKMLPLRATRESAQHDLNQYAEHRMMEVSKP